MNFYKLHFKIDIEKISIFLVKYILIIENRPTIALFKIVSKGFKGV